VYVWGGQVTNENRVLGFTDLGRVLFCFFLLGGGTDLGRTPFGGFGAEIMK